MEPLARIPDGVADDQAAALPIPAVTALRTVELLEVTAGQHVVVMGAAGGVGGYAVQMARSRGAHVIATVRGDAGEARRLGAEEVYDSQATDVIDALRAAHPDGADAVLDLVSGPDAIRRDAAVIRPGGRLVSTIFAADEGWFAERQITARNHASSANPLISPEGLTTVAQMLRTARSPRASVPPLTWTTPGRCWASSAVAACAARPSSASRLRPHRPGTIPADPHTGWPAEDQPLRRAGMARVQAQPDLVREPEAQAVPRDPIAGRELDQTQSMTQETARLRCPAESVCVMVVTTA